MLLLGIISWLAICFTFSYGFMLPWQASMGHYIPWESMVRGRVAARYARLGELVAGSSRTRLSLLLLAHIPDGIPLLLYWGLSCLCSVFWFKEAWKVLIEEAKMVLPVDTIMTFKITCVLIPFVMFVFARNAARTTVCGMCASTAEKKEGQKEGQSCASLRYSESVLLPCSFGQFFWPEIAAPKVAGSENDSFPIRVISNSVGDYAGHPNCPEKPGVPFEQVARMRGDHKGENGEHHGCSYPAERNEELLSRGGEEGLGPFRVANEARWNMQQEPCFSKTSESVFLGADLDSTWEFSDQSANEIVAGLVEKSVQTDAEIAKSEFGYGGKPEEDRGNTLQSRCCLELTQKPIEQPVANEREQKSYLGQDASLPEVIWFGTFLLFIYSFSLLFTAVRSRLDWWADRDARRSRPKVLTALSFLGWLLLWPVEMNWMWAAATGLGWTILRLL